MAKRNKHPDNFKSILAIIIILVIVVAYSVFFHQKYDGKQSSLGEAPPLLVSDYFDYNTEFCVYRLTDLMHEIYFLEQELAKEEQLLSAEPTIQPQEKTVLLIEQAELDKLKSELAQYTSMCDSFDRNPSPELCRIFMQDAEHYLNTAKSAAGSVSGQDQPMFDYNLRRADRIYKNLQQLCADTGWN